MLKILFISLLFVLNLNASFKDGEIVFKNKCSSCHSDYIDFNTLKENFFEKNNELLKLKAPSVNMLAYAIMESPKKVGDPEDAEMREIEINNYLKSYLEKPDRFNSICDEHILGFYDTKKSMKGQLNDEDYENLTTFFMEYKENLKKDNELDKSSLESIDEKQILEKAKKENKKIMVYATSKSCYFCKKMEREVLSLDEVTKKINQHYIFVKIDVDEKSLPFELIKEYRKITPTFFILSQKGKYIKQYPGAWVKKDFIEILEENKK